jgi:hypothetical protein
MFLRNYKDKLKDFTGHTCNVCNETKNEIQMRILDIDMMIRNIDNEINLLSLTTESR